jgi:hypothetical protein
MRAVMRDLARSVVLDTPIRCAQSPKRAVTYKRAARGVRGG